MNRHRRAPRFSAGNVTNLRPPEFLPASAWPWMAWHAGWWEERAATLDWKPIGTYEPPAHEGMAIASPVLLRDETRWLYGSRVGDEWCRFGEGGSYPIDDFVPTEWADVELDDAILLGQE